MPDLDYEGVIVLGSPRSGTTLLRRLLNAHPSIGSPPETNLLSAAARFIEEVPMAGGVTIGVLSGLAFSGFETQDTLERLREFIFGFFREIAKGSGKPVWAEKSGFDSFHVDGVQRICTDKVRYVCISRHPLDTICSIKELTDKMGVFLPELHEYVRTYPSLLEAFAHAWKDLNDRLLRLADENPDTVFSLRYEDLVSDPAPILERLFSFLGMPVDVEPILAEGLGSQDAVGLGDWKTYQKRTIDASSVGRWASLDDWTVARLASIVGPTMERLGYEHIEADAPDEEDARRQFQFGLMVARMREPGT